MRIKTVVLLYINRKQFSRDGVTFQSNDAQLWGGVMGGESLGISSCLHTYICIVSAVMLLMLTVQKMFSAL